MMDGSYLRYSEITDHMPTEADIEKLLQPLDGRNVLFLLCRTNMHFGSPPLPIPADACTLC